MIFKGERLFLRSFLEHGLPAEDAKHQNSVDDKHGSQSGTLVGLAIGGRCGEAETQKDDRPDIKDIERSRKCIEEAVACGIHEESRIGGHGIANLDRVGIGADQQTHGEQDRIDDEGNVGIEDHRHGTLKWDLRREEEIEYHHQDGCDDEAFDEIHHRIRVNRAFYKAYVDVHSSCALLRGEVFHAPLTIRMAAMMRPLTRFTTGYA